jgi:PGF-CTERM protein
MVSKKSFSAVLATLVILSVIAGTSITSAQTVIATQKTIVMTADETPTLSNLVAALNATNLTAALNDTTKNYTVFAPNDAAFAKLGNTTLNDLLKNNTTQLATILKSHVVVGSVNLTVNGTKETLAGNTIAWNTTGNVTKVQLPGGTNATVTQKNIATSNGQVNVIDTVLVPGAGTTTRQAVASAVASAAAGFLGLPGFEALYAVAGLLAVAFLVLRRRK